MQRFVLPYGLYRFMGISGLFLMFYIVVVGIFGNVDVGWMLPVKLATQIQEAWPRMPFFSVEDGSINNGKEHEVFYTVPTRQLTPQELAQLRKKPMPVKSTPEPAK